MSDDLVEMQQFKGVWIGEGRSNHTLFKDLTLGFSQKELGGQMTNIGGIVLDADLFGLAIDLDMGIETAVVIDARFKGDCEALILKKGRQKGATLSRGDDPSGHAEQFAHR